MGPKRLLSAPEQDAARGGESWQFAGPLRHKPYQSQASFLTPEA